MNDENRLGPGGPGSPWFLRWSPNPRAKLRLFCLPHAGGDTWIYRDWQRALPSFVEVCAIRLPGRGSRHAEPPVTDFDTLIESLGSALRDALDLPFALFGNSLGALIAFELARFLEHTAGRDATMLCVGSCRAPQMAQFPSISGLEPRAMVEELQRRHGRTMSDILQSDDLVRLNAPVIRADLVLCESYQYRSSGVLHCPITAYSGTKDPSVGVHTIEAWAEHTSGVFARHEIIGDHFFTVGSKEAFLRILSQDLEWAMA